MVDFARKSSLFKNKKAKLDLSLFCNSLLSTDHYSYQIIAYADIQEDGYIDHFYSHHQFQRQGVGSVLFAKLEQYANEKGLTKMYSNVSITAKPFFEAKGFEVEKEQFLKMGGQQVRNYRMVRVYE